MNNGPFCALGLDVGGTKVAAGIVTFPEGRLVERRIIPTLAGRGGEALLLDVGHLANDLAMQARHRHRTVQGVGLGICELVDRTGNIVSAHCVPWRHIPLPEHFASIAPAVIEADVRAAALGEAMFGAGRSFKIFLYVTIGTGISSCLMVDGQPFRGARGATGTMASSPLPSSIGSADAMPTLEELASGPGMVARFNRAGGAAQTAQEVLEAARAGHGPARAVVCSAAQALGASIGWLVNVLDPEAVLIGGGLGLSEGIYRETLIASARRHIWWESNRDLPMVSAGLGSDGGVIGAACVAWQRLGQT